LTPLLCQPLKVKDLIKDQGVDVTYIKVDEKEVHSNERFLVTYSPELQLLLEQVNGRALIQVCQKTGDNCIVLYPGTNAKYTAEYAKEVLEHFGPDDWILQQNEISQGGAIMQVAADKGDV
jgi:hypothetical protein